MKNLREEIKEIFLGHIEDNELDKLLSLFKQQMKEMVPKEYDNGFDRTEQEPTKDEITFNDGWNEFRKELLKNIEEIK